jgi:hypothetical protein
MRKSLWRLTMVLCVLLTMFGATASAQETDFGAAEGRRVHQKVET